MKKVFILILFINSTLLNAQDIIYFTDYKSTECKVITCNDSLIEYQIDDQTYIVNADNLFLVKFSSGEVKVFNKAKPAASYKVRSGNIGFAAFNLMFRKNTPIGLFVPFNFNTFPLPSFNISIKVWPVTSSFEDYDDLINRDDISWEEELDSWKSISLGINYKIIPYTMIYTDFGVGWIDKYQYAAIPGKGRELIRLTNIKRKVGFQFDPGIAVVLPLIKTQGLRIGISGNFGYSSLNFQNWKFVYGVGFSVIFPKY